MNCNFLKLLIVCQVWLGASIFTNSVTAQAAGVASPATGGEGRAVTRAACFPFETLTATDRAEAETLLLKALDSEALFTIVGDLKPMSSGFGELRLPLKNMDVARLAARRRILATWRCGDDLTAYVHYFQRTFNNERAFDGVVMRRSLIAEMINRRQRFWSFYGITPNAEPLEVLLTVEHDATTRRNIGYGYLFGYPDYAVNFFAEAADAETRTGEFVARDFLIIPTFDANRRFVWAIPKGYREQAIDREIRTRAETILNVYRTRRPAYIGAGKPGVLALVRDLLCDSQGRCAAGRAR